MLDRGLSGCSHCSAGPVTSPATSGLSSAAGPRRVVLHPAEASSHRPTPRRSASPLNHFNRVVSWFASQRCLGNIRLKRLSRGPRSSQDMEPPAPYRKLPGVFQLRISTILLFVIPLWHGVGDIPVLTQHIDRVFWGEHGHVRRAAMRLSLPKNSLYQKAKEYRIVLSRI